MRERRMFLYYVCVARYCSLSLFAQNEFIWLQTAEVHAAVAQENTKQAVKTLGKTSKVRECSISRVLGTMYYVSS